MQASTAIEHIFEQAHWSRDSAVLSASPTVLSNAYEPILHQAKLAYRVELENYLVDLCVFHEQELFVSCPILNLPQEITLRQEILKLAASLVAHANLYHRLKAVVHVNLLCLERALKLDYEEPIATFEEFLNDADFFYHKLAQPFIAQNSSLSLNATTQAPSQEGGFNQSLPISQGQSLLQGNVPLNGFSPSVATNRTSFANSTAQNVTDNGASNMANHTANNLAHSSPSSDKLSNTNSSLQYFLGVTP